MVRVDRPSSGGVDVAVAAMLNPCFGIKRNRSCELHVFHAVGIFFKLGFSTHKTLDHLALKFDNMYRQVCLNNSNLQKWPGIFEIGFKIIGDE